MRPKSWRRKRLRWLTLVVGHVQHWHQKSAYAIGSCREPKAAAPHEQHRPAKSRLGRERKHFAFHRGASMDCFGRIEGIEVLLLQPKVRRVRFSLERRVLHCSKVLGLEAHRELRCIRRPRGQEGLPLRGCLSREHAEGKLHVPRQVAAPLGRFGCHARTIASIG
eukprot:scaffold7923_cov121-Isochrysis_galbana.AAC.7